MPQMDGPALVETNYEVRSGYQATCGPRIESYIPPKALQSLQTL